MCWHQNRFCYVSGKHCINIQTLERSQDQVRSESGCIILCWLLFRVQLSRSCKPDFSVRLAWAKSSEIFTNDETSLVLLKIVAHSTAINWRYCRPHDSSVNRITRIIHIFNISKPLDVTSRQWKEKLKIKNVRFEGSPSLTFAFIRANAVW